jgi:hypothetical protein
MHKATITNALPNTSYDQQSMQERRCNVHRSSSGACNSCIDQDASSIHREEALDQHTNLHLDIHS